MRAWGVNLGVLSHAAVRQRDLVLCGLSGLICSCCGGGGGGGGQLSSRTLVQWWGNFSLHEGARCPITSLLVMHVHENMKYVIM